MIVRVFIFIAIVISAGALRAQTSSPAPTASPSLEQRVADLEAYVNNAARGSDSASAKTVSPRKKNRA